MPLIMTATGDCIDEDFEGGFSLVENKKNIRRSCTDFAHLMMFGIFFALWLGIAVHAYSAGYQLSDLIKEIPEKYQNEISIRLSQCRNVCALFVWFAVLFLGLYFMALRFLTKYVIYATIFLKSALLSALLLLVMVQGIALKISLPIIAVCFVFHALTLYTFKKVGHKTVCTIIQESCKAMACHPSSIAVVVIDVTLMGLLSYFIATVIFGLLTIPKEQKSLHDYKFEIDPPTYVFVLLVPFASCSLWMLTLIYNVGRMTLYGVFSNWYQTADKKRIPYTITFSTVHTILRYHFGTLTFGSTIFTIVQIIRITYDRWVDLYVKFRARQMTIFCFIIVLANATSNTFMLCVSYGTGYYSSMKDSFKLLMQHPMQFAATRILTEWMIFFGFVLIPSLTVVIASLFIIQNSDDYLPEVPAIALNIIAIISVTITSIFLDAFYAATTAVLFCFLEELRFQQNESEDISI